MVRLSSLLQGKATELWLQALRYGISGGLAFVVDFGLLYWLTHYCALHYMYSQLVGYSVGLVITYLMSILWVYDRRRVNNVALEFSLFALIGVVGIVLTSLLMYSLTECAQLHYLASKVITTLIVMGWNFTARKFILFR